MSLEHAILGFLCYRPYTGYDLKKIFDSSVRHFWPADQSQIYKSLGHLEERGFVRMKKKPQADRPERKVHYITRAGKSELLKWLSAPQPAEEPRSAGLIQVFFAGRLTDAQILSKFEAYASSLKETIKKYGSISARLEPFHKEVNSLREKYFWMLTMENGICSMRANLHWAQSVIRRIKDGQVPKGESR